MESLEQRVVRELIARKTLLVTAESCSGGLLAKRITDVPGASAMFHAGFITYSNAIKTAVLGVSPDLLAAHGAVSEPVARAMAEGARSVIQGARVCLFADSPAPDRVLGIALTGIAGPDGGSPDKPVGLVYIGLATPDGTTVRVIQPPDIAHDRDWHRHHACDTALEMVLHEALGF